MSNFNYCPVVWMFASKSSLLKLETTQKRALRFVLDDYTSDYHDLLKKADVPGMKVMALRFLAIEVYKCINGLNPKYLNDLFIVKECKYDLRDDSVINRNKVQTRYYGLKSFKDYGAKIWNVLPNCCKGAVSLWIERFNQILEWTKMFIFGMSSLYMNWTIFVSIITPF